MTMQAESLPDGSTGGGAKDTLEASAHRLLTWVTIGGLALGTYGTFQAVTSLVFGTSPTDVPFVSARFEAVHRLAVVTVLASQVLQLLGSAALWRRRLLGRTLLITYAVVYLGALTMVQFMRAIDDVSASAPGNASQHAFMALGQMHLLIYGSVFPMFLVVILTRPWIVKLLRRKGEPIPVPAIDNTMEQRRAA
jgi:hypothetical protein